MDLITIGHLQHAVLPDNGEGSFGSELPFAPGGFRHPQTLTYKLRNKNTQTLNIGGH
jgi:hypothetical protein